MFLEDNKKEIKSRERIFGNRSTISDPNSNIFVIIGCIIIIILFFFILYVVFFQKSGAGNTPIFEPAKISTSSVNKLPTFPDNGGDNKYSLGTSSEVLIAENVSFGYFYEKPKDDFNSTLNTYELPLNIKIDVKNYYEISRKINLDPYLEDLNKNGFAIIEKQDVFDNEDFFSSYQSLVAKDIPIVITNDFIIYYYQNTLKEINKEIEKNVFYEHVWNLGKSMYDISLARYKKTYSELGTVNDPVLEGQRLQLAYFTVLLKLLMPTDDQIIEDVNFSDPNKFNLQEADKYSFITPEYMRVDIEKEVEFIRQAQKKEKSPVFLYELDYKNFFVPENYKVNAKLNNFYLALKWLKSEFPLYYKNDICENCLFDKSDWILNFYAACSISKDLYDDQDLKNQWAIVYKFISFFSGLRQDLTYLHYHDSLREFFGENYNVSEIFSSNNPNRMGDIYKIQSKISQYNFSKIEGGLDRRDILLRPYLGMRLLQAAYWPNDYLFKKLTGEELVYNKEIVPANADKTICSRKKGEKYRCGGTGMDIINLVYPIEDSYRTQYFIDNISYQNYNEIAQDIKKELGNFNNYTWNNNLYWITLDIIKPMLNYNSAFFPEFTKNKIWKQEKDFNAGLGAWVNLHLDEDVLAGYYDSKKYNGGFGADNNMCNLYNYVEANPVFIEELISRNTMLIKMLSVLKVNEDTNAASIELKEFNKKLSRLLEIIKKELSNQKISNDDCRVIDDFARHYTVEKSANKVFNINLNDKNSIYSINKTKLLALIYKNGEDKVMVFGPVFNYKE
ncbi:DUF3160 domain-containing protein [Candidatus Parcubacteria bacterium]|nr:DUF3160 domain-containing protein [Candidatus Parcubacteria bacterium]